MLRRWNVRRCKTCSPRLPARCAPFGDDGKYPAAIVSDAPDPGIESTVFIVVGEKPEGLFGLPGIEEQEIFPGEASPIDTNTRDTESLGGTATAVQVGAPF